MASPICREHSSTFRLLGSLLGIGEEHALAMIAALSDVMWATGNDDPSNP